MSTLLALPDDLVAEILARCCDAEHGAASLGRLSTVCSRFRSLAHHRLAPRLLTLACPSRGGCLRWAVRHCASLETLSVTGSADVSDLRQLLARCQLTLRVLRLERLRHLADPHLFSMLPALQELHLPGCRKLGDSALVCLLLGASPPLGLRVLDLSNTGVSDAGVRLLSRCPLLASVNLQYSAEPDGAAYVLTSTTERAREESSVTHEGLFGWLSASATPSPLRRLCLSRRKAVRQAELQAILSAHAPFLTHLDVSHMNLEGEELLRWLVEEAPCARTLEHLNVAALALGGSMTATSARGLAAACPALQFLDLSNWRLGGADGSSADDALGELGRLPLTDLILVRMAGKMSAAGLRHLVHHCPSLERLTCVRSLPEKALALLARGYPQLTIHADTDD